VFRAVHAAAAVDCPRVVSRLPRLCAATDEKDENGMTPLMIAAQAPILKCETCPMIFTGRRDLRCRRRPKLKAKQQQQQ
jgi:hypothetical protein